MLAGRSNETYQLSHPFRQPLHFTVMSVMTATLSISMGFLRDGPMRNPRDRHSIVTVTVTERTAYVSGLLARVTMMMLVTVYCEGFLDDRLLHNEIGSRGRG
jgi:hypothetical protein